VTPFGGEHAVVVGGSLTGLIAPAALARHFHRATLLERDPLSVTAETRKDVLWQTAVGANVRG
jgi:2-polyprenyl-6-methoxyphenol hydroxylase-like FAD-dependent oxidoreductase